MYVSAPCRQQCCRLPFIPTGPCNSKPPCIHRAKEKKLNDLRQALRQRISDENRFTLLGEYLDEYRSYNTDSSLYISRERYQVALRMKTRNIRTTPSWTLPRLWAQQACIKKQSTWCTTYKSIIYLMTCTRIITIFTAPSMASWPIMPLRNRRKTLCRDNG